MKHPLGTSLRAWVIVVVVFLSIVAALADDKYVKSKEAVFPEVQPDRALVYFARPDFTRLIPESTFKVFADSTPVGWLPQRSYLAAQVDPGSKVVWGPLRASQRFDFQAGKTYFLILVEQYGSPNRAVVGASWESGDPAFVRAFVASKKLSYVKPNDEELAKLREEGSKRIGKAEERAPEVHASALPATFENVWYRTGKRGFAWKAYDARGTLTVSADTIDYKSDKANVTIPVKDVKSVSLDKFTGLVNSGDDSDWGMVEFNNAGSEEIAAFGDGRHSPGGTERIFLTLQSVAKRSPTPQQQTVSEATTVSSPQPAPAAPQETKAPAASSASTGQGLPEGFVPYEGSKDEFTIAIPKDWTGFDQGQMLKATGMDRMAGQFGLIIFYQSKDSASTTLSPDLMAKIDTGEVPSFFLQKQRADKGMSCTGFSEKAAKRAVDLIGKDPEFKGKNAVEPAHAEPAVVGGCKGLRIRAKGQRSPGSTMVADAYVASGGETLYVFSLRNPVDNYDKNVDVFQKAVSTLKLAAAK
jgi:hypothetical protein